MFQSAGCRQFRFHALLIPLGLIGKFVSASVQKTYESWVGLRQTSRNPAKGKNVRLRVGVNPALHQDEHGTGWKPFLPITVHVGRVP